MQRGLTAAMASVLTADTIRSIIADEIGNQLGPAIIPHSSAKNRLELWRKLRKSCPAKPSR